MWQTLKKKNDMKSNTPIADAAKIYDYVHGCVVPVSIARDLELKIDHWKSNHDNIVKMNQALRNRPDLKDRSRSIIALINEIESLKEMKIESYGQSLRKDNIIEEIQKEMISNTPKEKIKLFFRKKLGDCLFYLSGIFNCVGIIFFISTDQPYLATCPALFAGICINRLYKTIFIK